MSTWNGERQNQPKRPSQPDGEFRAVEESRIQYQVPQVKTYGLKLTDPRQYSMHNFSLLIHGGIGDWDNKKHLAELFQDLDNSRHMVFCTFWSTQEMPASWRYANLSLDMAEGEVLWSGSAKNRRFYPFKMDRQTLHSTHIPEMRKERDAHGGYDLTRYNKDITPHAQEIDVYGARINAVHLSMQDTPNRDEIQTYSEFTALALKNGLPIILWPDRGAEKQGLFDRLIEGDPFKEILAREHLGHEKVKEWLDKQIYPKH